MFLKVKKICQGIIPIALSFFVLFSCIPFASADVNEEVVTIYHTNDMHGRVSSSYKNGVLDQIGADVLKSVKDQTPNSILVDAGDATQGTPIATNSNGSDVITMMNAAGYDGMTLGNHEFDYGQSAVLKNANLAKFPVVSANTVLADEGTPFLEGINSSNGCNFIKKVNNKKIGFFGITTTETAYKTKASNVDNIKFKDEKETSQAQIDELKNQGADVIVGIMHVGIDGLTSVKSTDLAKELNGIDIIIDGHSHSKCSETVNGVLIEQTGTLSKNLGKIDIKFKHNGSFTVDSKLIKAADLGSSYQANSDVTKLYNELYDKQRPLFEKVVGKTKTPLFAGSYEGKAIVRQNETNLGDLVADSMVENAKQLINEQNKDFKVVAIQNGGTIRKSIDAGFITQEEILDALPMGNSICVKQITPKKLYQVLENGVCKIDEPKSKGDSLRGEEGRFPQISGMRFEYDLSKDAYNPSNPTKSSGDRVTKIVLLNEFGTDDKELLKDDDTTQIAVAMNDFEATGGDEYTVLKDLPTLVEGDSIDKIFLDYIRNLSIDSTDELEYPFLQNRIILNKSDKLFGNYDATLNLTNASNKITSDEVQVTIDNSVANNMNTNEDGQITLSNLSSGAHLVKLEYQAMTAYAYINELSGIKETTVAFQDRTNEEVNSVSNLINQIPDKVTQDDAKFIKFIRTSYDALTDRYQSGVTNYYKLTKAESELANPNLMNGLNIIFIVIAVLALVAVVIVIIYIYLKKKHNTKRKFKLKI